MTKYTTYREDTALISAFESYTTRHYQSWVAFASHKQYGNDIQPVLVCGLDMTKDFAMVAYSNDGTSLGSSITIAIPTVASASATLWGTWHTRCSAHTNTGPHFPRQPATQPEEVGKIPRDFDQCVFVRYCTMRLRRWRLPKRIQAGAGPHDLGPGDNTGDFPQELTVQPHDEPTTSDDENLRGRSDPITDDDDDDEPDIVVFNPPYVWFLPCPSTPALTFTLRMRKMTTGMLLQIMYSR